MMSSLGVEEVLHLVLKFQKNSVSEVLNLFFENKTSFYCIHGTGKKIENGLICKSMEEHEIILKRSSTDNSMLIENRKKGQHLIYLLTNGKNKSLLEGVHRLKEDDKFVFELLKDGKIAYSFNANVEAIALLKNNNPELKASLVLTYYQSGNKKASMGQSTFNFAPLLGRDCIDIIFSKDGIKDVFTGATQSHDENIEKIFDSLKKHSFMIRYAKDNRLHIRNIGGTSNPITLINKRQDKDKNVHRSLKNLEPKEVKNGDEFELIQSDSSQSSFTVLVTFQTGMKSKK